MNAPIHAETRAVPGLGRAPEGQGRLDAILHVELAVPYFPFRQTTPRTSQVLRVTQELQCLNLKPRHYQNSYSQYPLRHIGSTLAQHLSFVWVGYH
jgi:hypothetical protein